MKNKLKFPREPRSSSGVQNLLGRTGTCILLPRKCVFPQPGNLFIFGEKTGLPYGRVMAGPGENLPVDLVLLSVKEAGLGPEADRGGMAGDKGKTAQPSE